VEEGERSSFSCRQCYSARHPHAIRLAMDWWPRDLRAAVRGETAVSALPTADSIGSLSRGEKEPTGTVIRPALCRRGCYEEVPPPEPPLPPPDVPPIGGQDGGGV
jgi:hypothetical protein